MDTERPRSPVARRRQLVRERMTQAKSIRRADTQLITHLTSQSTLHALYTATLNKYIQERDREGFSLNCAPIIADMLAEKGVTAENIRNRTSPRQMWDDYLNPLYNSLRGFISRSKRPEHSRLVSEFWLAVAAELQIQLAAVAQVAEISVEALGQPKFIVENELGR